MRDTEIMEVLRGFQLKYLVQNAEISTLREILFGVVSADGLATNPNYLTELKLEFWDILGEKISALLCDEHICSHDSSRKQIVNRVDEIKKMMDDLEKDLVDL